MENQKSSDATTRADNLRHPAANKTSNLEGSHEPVYPNEANESGGAGSPYGGTQSPDEKAPDGNQQLNPGDTRQVADRPILPEALGDEYGTPASYGRKARE